MLTFNATLTTTLTGAASKTAWCNAIVTALGATRALRCKRDANAAAADVWATGTEFINVAVSGAMTVEGDTLTGMGTTGAFTTRLAADLSTGASVLRIEGNGNWVQGTLGLAGSGADFILSGSPTTATSVAFDNALTIRAPRLLPSGTGPVAPTLDASAPATIELWNWQNPAAPTLTGTLAFNTRRDDYVFQDADVAAEMGDVRVTQSTQSIVYGDFEFGAMLLSMNAACNSEAAVPLHQVLVGCKPYGAWATYPAFDTYDPAQVTAYPQPFKILIKDGAGNLLHTYQMHDGLPINSPLCKQVRADQDALRPHFNCGMLLPWQSHRPKESTKKAIWYPGHIAAEWRESLTKNADATIGAVPLLTGATQFNSVNQWFALPQWPQPAADSYVVQGNDPYLFPIIPYYTGADGSGSNNLSQAIGWDYEPGSISGHDWFTGPGGPRIDRYAIPAPLAMYLTTPGGTYLKDGVPYRTKADAWGKAYFNHACHYLRDVKTFQTLPTQEIWTGQWSYSRHYYGGLDSYVAGGKARSIAQYAMSSATPDQFPRDLSGHMIWGGWALDALHAYAQPGWWALLLNSPMHAIAATHRVNASFLAGIIHNAPTEAYGWMERNGAWRWLHWVIAWKLASAHPMLGLDRKTVEARFTQELEAIHASWVVPSTDPTHASYNSRDMRILRALGQPVLPTAKSQGDGTYAYTVRGSALCYYMAPVWLLMKQCGLWTVMYNKSAKCKAALDLMIASFDKYAFDYILDTDGRVEAYTPVGPASSAATTPEPYPITSWADWSTYFPKTGVEDWITNADGSPRTYERDIAQHMRAQYAFMRRDWFAEFPNARMIAACNKYQAFYDAVAARTAAAPQSSKGVTDWQRLFMPAMKFKAPA